MVDEPPKSHQVAMPHEQHGPAASAPGSKTTGSHQFHQPSRFWLGLPLHQGNPGSSTIHDKERLAERVPALRHRPRLRDDPLISLPLHSPRTHKVEHRQCSLGDWSQEQWAFFYSGAGCAYCSLFGICKSPVIPSLVHHPDSRLNFSCGPPASSGPVKSLACLGLILPFAFV